MSERIRTWQSSLAVISGVAGIMRAYADRSDDGRPIAGHNLRHLADHIIEAVQELHEDIPAAKIPYVAAITEALAYLDPNTGPSTPDDLKSAIKALEKVNKLHFGEPKKKGES